MYWVIGSGAVFRLKGPGEIGTDPLPCATLPRDAERVELDPDSAMTQAVILGESRTYRQHVASLN